MLSTRQVLWCTHLKQGQQQQRKKTYTVGFMATVRAHGCPVRVTSSHISHAPAYNKGGVVYHQKLFLWRHTIPLYTTNTEPSNNTCALWWFAWITHALVFFCFQVRAALWPVSHEEEVQEGCWGEFAVVCLAFSWLRFHEWLCHSRNNLLVLLVVIESFIDQRWAWE